VASPRSEVLAPASAAAPVFSATPTLGVKIYRTYDWVGDDGYKNLGNWIEEVAIIAGK
jgi:hypothetical protein